jgi:RNA binding exosome subunit
MNLEKLTKVYESFRNTNSEHREVLQEKNRHNNDSDVYALLDKQARMLDELERAKYEILLFAIDQYKERTIDIYDRWSETDEEATD